MTDALNLDANSELLVVATDDAEVNIQNGGPGTVYYKSTSGVSTTSYDGTIADGASLQSRANKWIISSATSKVFIEPTAHVDDTINVHGIADTSDLMTLSGSQEISGQKVFTGIFQDHGSPADPGDYYSPQIEIFPNSTAATYGRAEIHLHGRDANDAFDKRKHAMIQFWTSTDYSADATLKAHIHDAGGAGGFQHHIQFHTKDSSTGELIDRFLIQIGADDAAIQISAAHLQFHTDAYISGTAGSVTGEVPIRGYPTITSQSSSTKTQLSLGRTSADVIVGVAGAVGDYGTGASAAGDVVIRQNTATKRLILQAGNDASAIIISGVDAATPKIGFFNTTPAAQPTGVAVSAAGIHAALVTLGLITA